MYITSKRLKIHHVDFLWNVIINFGNFQKIRHLLSLGVKIHVFCPNLWDIETSLRPKKRLTGSAKLQGGTSLESSSYQNKNKIKWIKWNRKAAHSTDKYREDSMHSLMKSIHLAFFIFHFLLVVLTWSLAIIMFWPCPLHHHSGLEYEDLVHICPGSSMKHSENYEGH